MSQLKKIKAEKQASNTLQQAQHRQKYRQLAVVAKVLDEPAAHESLIEKADHRARRNPAAKNELPSAVRHDSNDPNRTASSIKAGHTDAVRVNGHSGTDFPIQVACRQLVLVASLMTV